jgi:hypothetical protein
MPGFFSDFHSGYELAVKVSVEGTII